MHPFNKAKSINKILGYMKDEGNNDRIKVKYNDSTIAWIGIENVNCPLLLSDFFIDCENKILNDFYSLYQNNKLDNLIIKKFENIFQNINQGGNFQISFLVQQDQKASGIIKNDRPKINLLKRAFNISGRVSHKYLENIIYDFQLKNCENLILFPLENFSIMKEFVDFFKNCFQGSKYALVDENGNGENQLFLMKNTIFKKLYDWDSNYVIFYLSKNYDLLVEQDNLLIPSANEITFKNIINNFNLQYKEFLVNNSLMLGPKYDTLKNNFENFYIYMFKNSSEIKKVFINKICLNFYRSSNYFREYLERDIKIYQYYKKSGIYIFEEIYKEGGIFTFSNSIILSAANSPYIQNFIKTIRESDIYKIQLPVFQKDCINQLYKKNPIDKIKNICEFLYDCISPIESSSIIDFIKKQEQIYFKEKRKFYIVHKEDRDFYIKSVNTLNNMLFM